MTQLRVVGTIVAAMVIGVVAIPAQASDQDPGLPLESASTKESCELPPGAADANSCTVRASSSVSRAVSAQSRLTSPSGGTAPWSARADSLGQVTANYRLAQPVRELNFAIEVQINRAEVSIGPGLEGMAGWYVNQYDLGRAAQVHVTGAAVHSSCYDCTGGTNLIVLSAWKPGTTNTASNQGVVLEVKMTRNNGADIPPGIVTIRTGVGAPVWQSRTWGDDSASVDAVVRKIALA